MQMCWRTAAGRMPLQTSGFATQLQTNHTNTLASRKPSWRLRAGVSSAAHLLSFTELISIKTGWSEQMEDVIEFPWWLWIPSCGIVAFSCQGLQETADFSFSVEMLSSAADKSFLCFPKSLQNLEKQLQCWAGTAGFFYFGGGGGAREAVGDRGKEAEYASRLMVKIHGGSRYLGSGWRLQLFQALRAKTLWILELKSVF